MTRRADTGGGPAVLGDLNTQGGDAVLRDQIKLNLIGNFSAEQIESFLLKLPALLTRPDTELCPDPEQERLRLVNPNGSTVLLSAEAAAALLPAAARCADPDAYLSALLVHPRYGRWERRYVPLAGALTQTRKPAGWDDIEPELTALEASGEGAGSSTCASRTSRKRFRATTPGSFSGSLAPERPPACTGC